MAHLSHSILTLSQRSTYVWHPHPPSHLRPPLLALGSPEVTLINKHTAPGPQHWGIKRTNKSGRRATDWFSKATRAWNERIGPWSLWKGRGACPRAGPNNHRLLALINQSRRRRKGESVTLMLFMESSLVTDVMKTEGLVFALLFMKTMTMKTCLGHISPQTGVKYALYSFICYVLFLCLSSILITCWCACCDYNSCLW